MNLGLWRSLYKGGAGYNNGNLHFHVFCCEEDDWWVAMQRRMMRVSVVQLAPIRFWRHFCWPWRNGDCACMMFRTAKANSGRVEQLYPASLPDTRPFIYIY